MSDVTPRISVVMATYNRADILHRTLQCLAEQDLPVGDYEVIVIDDGSSDHTRQIVAEEAQRARLRLSYLQHPNRGPGYTQNRGIHAARAPLILLMADDIFLSPGALRAHIEGHRRHPEAQTACLGRVLQSPELTQTVFLRHWDPFRLSGLTDDQELPYHMFWACNISCRRDFMLEHGMFRDEMGRAGAAAHEDVELGYRLHQHGLRIFFCRDALGHHHHVETLEGTLRRSYQRGLNWLDFRERVPQPEIDVRYRVYNLVSLLKMAGALRKERKPYLLGGDAKLSGLALRYLLRSVLFNGIMIQYFWLPLYAQAERRPWLAALMRDGLYRGAVVYYFLKGCRDGGWSLGRSSRATGLSGG